MPGGVNGRQLADQATRLRPGLKVLFMTGYTRNAIVHHGRLDAGVHLIGKPFSFEELAAKVRERLDARIDRDATPFGSARSVAAVALASSEREDLAGFQFGFVCFRGFAGRKSFPSANPARSARPRRSATAALVRSTTRLAGVCSRAAWVLGELGHGGFSSSEVEGRE